MLAGFPIYQQGANIKAYFGAYYFLFHFINLSILQVLETMKNIMLCSMNPMFLLNSLKFVRVLQKLMKILKFFSFSKNRPGISLNFFKKKNKTCSSLRQFTIAFF